MLRTLLTPRWLLGLLLAAVFAVVTILLGNWQWREHQAALDRRATIEAHYDQEPVPLQEVLEAGDGFPIADQWTAVSATGRYAADGQLMVRNRPLRGTYGYEVLVPLDLDAGGTVLVDRGWVRNAEDATTLPVVPPAPDGPVTVVGWLKAGEPSLGRDLPAGQLASINLDEAADALGRPVLDAFVVLDREDVASGATPERPEALEPPDTGLGAHLAYSIQWWMTSVLGFVLVFVFARREHREGQSDDPQTPVPTPKKVRIWDEEDE